MTETSIDRMTILHALQAARDEHYHNADKAIDRGDTTDYVAEYNIAHGISRAIGIYLKEAYK